MSKTRDTNLPQHHLQQGHYGDLSFDELPSGSLTGETLHHVSGTGWAVGYPLLIQEEGVNEGRVWILDMVGPGVDVQILSSGVARITVASGSSGQLGGLNYVIGDGTNVISTGQKGHIRWPFTGTLQRATLMADISGSIVVDVWKDTYSNFPPNSGDSITASAKPTLSTAIKSEDISLSGWTIGFNEGDIYTFNVDSAATLRRVTLELKYQRT